MTTNKAAFLDAAGQTLHIRDAETPEPAANEVIIRNHAVAVNPLDWKQQDIGLFIQSYPYVLGYDIAGEITSVGAAVSDVNKGDRVVAQTATLRYQDARFGGFQLYTAVPSERVARIPDNVSFAEGSVLPVAVDTAAGALFTSDSGESLGLPLPTLDAKDSGKIIVLWGGSSSVGAIASQLAASAGVKVITTASPHNFEFCRGNGVSEVFDYRKDTVVDDIVRAVKSSGREFAGVFDTISEPKSFELVVPIIEKLGGGKIITTLPPPENTPDNIKFSMVHGENSANGNSLRKSFMGLALEKGSVKAMPEPHVVGRGLEAIQEGLNESKKGVSAKKLVIEL